MVKRVVLVVLLAMSTQPAGAAGLTNGNVVQYCGAYINNSFSVAGLTENQQTMAFVCLGFHLGVQHSAQAVCAFSSNEVEKQKFGSAIDDVNALIQMSSTWAKENPKTWDNPVIPHLWLGGTCK